MDDLSSRPKRDARAWVRARGALSPEQRRSASEAIVARLLSLPAMSAARCVMGFLPLVDEPEITPVLESILSEGRTLALPAVEWEAGVMRPVRVLDLSRDVVETRHGVREPRAGLAEVTPAEIDAVLVPGLAFDLGLGRLGRGGGFYDRFLGTPGLRALRVGVAFESRVVVRLPREDHDVSMDVVVTESRVIGA